MEGAVAAGVDAQAHILEHGYVVLDGLIGADEVARLRASLDVLMARERTEPFDPGDGPAYAGEDEHVASLAGYWRPNITERERLRRRLRHTRAENFDTPWPVGVDQICGCFRHIPTLYDDDRSQRVFNLINKAPEFAVLIEHPVMLALMSALLGRDCILLDVSASSVGPDTEGGGLHVDSPITNMAEPLPDLTLSIQAVWMLTDFTIENGASRVVPGSHRSRRKPDRPHRDDEVALTSPAGSVRNAYSDLAVRGAFQCACDPQCCSGNGACVGLPIWRRCGRDSGYFAREWRPNLIAGTWLSGRRPG